MKSVGGFFCHFSSFPPLKVDNYQLCCNRHTMGTSEGLECQMHRALEDSLYFAAALASNTDQLFLRRFLNDQEISDGGNFSLGEKDSVYRLDIGCVDSDLVGKIKVTAENENGKDEKEVSEGILAILLSESVLLFPCWSTERKRM